MASYVPQAMFDLRGRVAIVTGGGTGIGWMISKGLAASGAKVYITGRRLDVLEKAASEWDKAIGGDIVPLQLDVTDKQSILAAKARIETEEGRLHILVNNAGQVGPCSNFFGDPSAPEQKDAETLGQALFNNESFEQWSQLYTINTFSIFFMTTAFLGLLAKGGEEIPGHWSSVVNITSISGVMKLAQDHFCYNSSKAAATHLTKMLSTEILLKGYPIRINAVAPGVYESEMTWHTITPEAVDKVAKGVVPVPARRPGSGEEVAGTVVYLVSKAGGYTHGQEIVIDGGALAVNPSVA
ncbi:short-chain dehydrogenase [Coprinopsis cinerea okayama7|uniref:Short-chain dehydrogenase n=1 Tax=Coprinopsis cinerea (strain Okayama-7 / 130 / ATCC MYA-4618 / FGSC 9003) TaxID=240176 RepID=A8NRT9_COPC7|nr:short-chain dehydrogenase [Coprinopsis cinerea okayama7\|eukprot:XP_001835853.1 short-chain dehydrogenase [Coprinopsis cinerea okayama7\